MKIGEFSLKGKRFAFRPPERDKRYSLLCGSIRSTKTWQMLAKLRLFLIDYPVGGERIITGVSKGSIQHNILNDLFQVLGEGNYSYNRQTGDLQIRGSMWSVVGANDEGSEKYIRGRTVGLAYCDELTLMPRTFFMMLIGRMSPEGARLYATTNTDSPFHWLKTEVIDNPEMKDLLWVQNYSLDDNLHLSQEYKESVKRSYTGVFYRRFISGEWVLAEGAIYRDVLTDAVFYTDETRPVGLRGRGGHRERWIAVDYGTHNPCVFIDVYDDGDTVWFDREYYWDSQAQSRQKTDREYADDLITFVGGEPRTWPGIIVDPSAASFRAELIARGFYVTDANNAVEDGIRRMSSMLSRQKLRINREGCPRGIMELQAYAWDEKSGAKGNEQPIKAHDHFPDAGRYYINTRISDWRIAA